MKRLMVIGIYLLSALLGLAAFAFPFLQPAQQANAPVLAMGLLGICLAALLLEMQAAYLNTRVVAVLGMLVAMTSVLRLLEVAIPGPAGFSPIFVPIILAGYVFGARFGFLLGVLALLVSALLTGGVGPWLPYQMFTAGWVGLSAGLLPHPKQPRRQLMLLIVFGAAWGLLYGLIINLYFWPFLGEAGRGSGVRGYAAFYLATSLVWDGARALGNGLLLWALGMPAVRALARFKDRLAFEVVAAGPAAASMQPPVVDGRG